MISKRNFLFIFFVLLNAIQTAFSSIFDQIFRWKVCPPKPKLFTQLEVKPFIGRWYNHLAVPNIFEKGKCGSTNYYYDNTNTTLYNQDKELRGDKWVTSPINKVTYDAPGVLTFHMYFITAEFNVLDTDYTSYAIVYSCRNLYIVNPLKMAWILTRKPIITEEEKAFLYKKAETLFKDIDVKLSDMEPILQDCPDN